MTGEREVEKLIMEVPKPNSSRPYRAVWAGLSLKSYTFGLPAISETFLLMAQRLILLMMINTALVSFGMSGSVFHAPFIEAHPGYVLYGVLERSKNLAVEKYPDIHTYLSLEDLLADTKIDLVIVNSAITKNAPLPVTVVEAINVIRVIEAAVVSKREGKVVRMIGWR